jgi:ABC-2 type transport system permease protein
MMRKMDAGMLREVDKHGRIYGLLVRNFILEQLQYRTNIFLFIFVEFGYVAARLLYVLVVQETGVRINGMPPQSIYLFSGTSLLLMTFCVGMLQFNVIHFGKKVREGELDLLLVKPVSFQFIATLRHADFISASPNAFVGIPLIVYGWRLLALPADFSHIAGFLLFILLGLLVMYGLLTLPMILAFYFFQVDEFNSIVWALWDFNSLPCRIQPYLVQWVGIYLFPIFLIANFSPLFAMHRLSRMELAWGLVAPFLLLGLVRIAWSRAVRQYGSASS